MKDLNPLKQDEIDMVIEKIAEEFITHKRGLFIVAPSGAGKSHFIKNQNELNWIDGDELWIKSGAHPKRAWWLEGFEMIDEIDKRSDFVTSLALKKGLWIMGASNNWLKPDAIVIPDWDDHVRMIKHREVNNYDGGAKSDSKSLAQVKSHIEQIIKWEKLGVPKFKSVSEAVNFLTNNL